MTPTTRHTQALRQLKAGQLSIRRGLEQIAAGKRAVSQAERLLRMADKPHQSAPDSRRASGE